MAAWCISCEPLCSRVAIQTLPLTHARSDANEEALKSAKQYIDETLPSVLRDVVPGEPGPGELKVFTDRAKAIEGAWVVTEAVPEILQLKIDLLGELDAVVPPDVIIATNSSSYTSSEMIEKVTHRDRIVNTHYYMPPRSNPVEIMPNQWTSPDIAPLYYAEAAKHGLKPYHVRKESVGLIANRIWAAIKREALYVAAEGVAEPHEIDALLRDALGFPGGPFAMMDGVGLDVVRDIEAHYHAVRSGLPKEPLEYVEAYVKAGKLGEKSGEGFYTHPATKPHVEDHLVYLDLVKGQVNSMSVSGTERKTLLQGLVTMPDGVQQDQAGVIYFTNMGRSASSNDGSLQRFKPTADKAAALETIVAPGQTHTPKQLHLDQASGKLYWCDREGGRIQRSNLDGSSLETLYDSAPGEARPLTDQTKWCVGITVDPNRQLVYWSQKGSSKGAVGRLFRAHTEVPTGETAASRTDIETLFDHLPEPIDLELDVAGQQLFWTDRGDPPFGNTLNRADVSAELDPKRAPQHGSAKLVIAERFHEAIGLALDARNQKIYVADLLGSIWRTDFDGKNKTAIVRDEGNFTGIALSRGAGASA